MNEETARQLARNLQTVEYLQKRDPAEVWHFVVELLPENVATDEWSLRVVPPEGPSFVLGTQ